MTKKWIRKLELNRQKRKIPRHSITGIFMIVLLPMSCRYCKKKKNQTHKLVSNGISYESLILFFPPWYLKGWLNLKSRHMHMFKSKIVTACSNLETIQHSSASVIGHAVWSLAARGGKIWYLVCRKEVAHKCRKLPSKCSWIVFTNNDLLDVNWGVLHVQKLMYIYWGIHISPIFLSRLLVMGWMIVVTQCKASSLGWSSLCIKL